MVLNIFSLTIEIYFKRIPRDFGTHSEELDDPRLQHAERFLKEVKIRHF